MITVLLYIILIILFTWFNRSDWHNPVFQSKGKVSWWLSGLSIFMIHLSVDQGQLVTGLISEHGMQGMWFVWSGLIIVFVIPIVFAPLWKKLNFITDNQFILFRFHGKESKFLHVFRAIYVGGLVVGLAISFHVLGFSRIIESIFNIKSEYAILFSGLVLCFFALRNVLDLKIKMDALNAFIYLLSFAIIGFYCFKTVGNLDNAFQYFEQFPEKKDILPSTSDSVSWFSIIVFIGIQWWSSNLFDGGGPEMARFTAVKNKRSAVLAGLMPIVLFFVLSFLLLFQVLVILGVSGEEAVGERQYVIGVFQIVPEAFKGLIFIGFFTMFITSCESLMNWGASFLTIDVFKNYLAPNSSTKRIRLVSFLTMVFICLVATIFAFSVNSLQGLAKITFSIAAGVAPVYILRWIWHRINAWSQISAMVSSGVFTLIYPYIHNHIPFANYPLEESRLVVVTILTTCVWVLLTLLTKDKSEQTKLVMQKTVTSTSNFLKRLALALFLGISLMLVTVSVWWYLLG